MSDMKEYISEINKLLPLGKSISQPDAEKRAGQFLAAMAKVTDWRHILSEEKIRCLSVRTAVYAEEMQKNSELKVAAGQAASEAAPAYIEAREGLERIENDLNYLKACYDIFMNGHLFYRQMAKGEML